MGKFNVGVLKNEIKDAFFHWTQCNVMYLLLGGYLRPGSALFLILCDASSNILVVPVEEEENY